MVKGLPVKWGACSRTVPFKSFPRSLACWKDLIAVGFDSHDIIILDIVTGICTSVLSGCTTWAKSLAFSSNGMLLASGGSNKTVDLWDVQTGGIVKTFHGHTDWVVSISISLDHATIASGSWDNTIHLWDIKTGECCCVIYDHNDHVNSINFSPTNPQLLISASDDNTIRQWDTNGHQIGPTYDGRYVTFSSDGTCFISWRERVATIQNSTSGVIIAELHVPNDVFQCCCFSPDGKSVAGGVGSAIYIWDITSPDPYLVETFVGHTSNLTSITFSSSLISSSYDRSIKFWQIGTSLVTTDSEPTPVASTPINSVSLQASKGIVISSDGAGVVKTWDISTGLCKASFHTPAQDNNWRDAQLINGRLVFVWYSSGRIYIWDAGKGRLLQTVDASSNKVMDLKISGDGSKVFLQDHRSIRAWSLSTGEVVGVVQQELPGSLIVEGSRVWVQAKDSTWGWDFGIPGLKYPPVLTRSPNRPCLDLISSTEIWNTSPPRIKDTVTGKEVFQLPKKYIGPTAIHWDGQYLVAGYKSGELLILDFGHMVPRKGL